MKKSTMLLLAGLLLAAPASHMRARANACTQADEALDGETLSRVLGLAAPEFGLTDGQIAALYDAGQVLIDDLGPIRGGHRYGMTYNALSIFIDDLMAS